MPQTEMIAINYNAVADFLSYIDRGSQTERTYMSNLKQFAAWLSYENIKNPMRSDIVRYKEYLKEPHEAIAYDPVNGWRWRTDPAGNRIIISCKPATVAGYLQAVKRFFKWLYDTGKYPDIAKDVNLPKIQKDIRKKVPLTVEALQRINESIEKRCNDAKDNRQYEKAVRIKAIFYLCAVIGLRAVEVSRAKVKDLETQQGQAALWIWGKGHEEPDARKELPDGIYNAIKEYLSAREIPVRPESPLFTATGNRSGGHPIAARTIGAMLKAEIKAAGYEADRITAHSLRHSAGTMAMQRTKDIYTVQHYMRHKDPRTTEIYIHTETEKQEARLAADIFDSITARPAIPITIKEAL